MTTIITRSSKGSAISATENDANLNNLNNDKVEETSGAWTPVLTDTITPATLSTAYGDYVRIGSMVHAKGRITASDITGMSGAIVIQGLPFTSSSTPNSHGGGAVTGASGLSITAGQSLACRVSVNSAEIKIRKWSATTGTAELDAANLTATVDIQFEVTYYV